MVDSKELHLVRSPMNVLGISLGSFTVGLLVTTSESLWTDVIMYWVVVHHWSVHF